MKDVLVEFDVNDQPEIDRLFGVLPAHIKSWDYEKNNIPVIDLREWGCIPFPTFRIRFISTRKSNGQENATRKQRPTQRREDNREGG